MLELAPWLLLGAVVGGMLHVLLPAGWLNRQLTGRWAVVKAVLIGTPLPLCSCGVIPTGLSLRKSGASQGAAVGFLISTPQTGVDSILVSASMLGWPFAIFKVAAALFTGVLGGWLTDRISEPDAPAPLHKAPESKIPLTIVDADERANAPANQETGSVASNRSLGLILHSIELLRSIWRWLVFGVLVSAAITTWVPPQAFSTFAERAGFAAPLAMLLLSIPLYVCATASVPIAASLVAGGFPAGAAIVFLMAGPATNVATIGAIYRTLGARTLAIYLSTLILGSLVAAWGFDSLIGTSTAVAAVHHHHSPTWWSIASVAVLIGLLAWFAVEDARRLLGFSKKPTDDCCSH